MARDTRKPISGSASGAAEGFTWYVLELDGERETFDGATPEAPYEPLAAQIRIASAREHQRIVGAAVTSGQARRMAKSDANAIADHEGEVFAAMVGEVRGYSVGGEPIRNGRELWDRGELAVVQEIQMAYRDMNRLSEGARFLSAS